MIKKYGWLYTINYYGIIWHLGSLLLVMIFMGTTAGLIRDALLADNMIPTVAEVVYKCVPIAMLAAWSVMVFTSVRDKRYRYLTGRFYGKDHSFFNRTYGELVDYFRYESSQPHKLDVDKYKLVSRKAWRAAKGIVLGMSMNSKKDKNGRLITIPSSTECNIAIYGPPGTGKTSGPAIINCMTFQGSVLAVDIKGDIYNYVSQHSKRRIIRFCPDHPDALNVSARFNPFGGIERLNVAEKKLFIENMCTVLIPDEGGNEGNYFTSRARKMMQGIYYLLEDKYKAHNKMLTFPAFVHEILEGNIIDWVKTAVDSNNLNAKEYLASFYGNSEKNICGAYDALSSSLIHFANPILDRLLDGRDKHCISIDYLEEGYDIYLQISQEHLDSYAPLFTLIIQNFSTAFTKRPDSSTGYKNRPILMLLDEFPQMTFSYKMINSNLSTLRSKSVICCLIQQGIAQLENKYKDTGARAIMGNCNYQIILGSTDTAASDTFSKLCGMKKNLKRSNSLNRSRDKSHSVSVQEVDERVFPPEYFGDLRDKGTQILYMNGKYCECYKLNCYVD